MLFRPAVWYAVIDDSVVERMSTEAPGSLMHHNHNAKPNRPKFLRGQGWLCLAAVIERNRGRSAARGCADGCRLWHQHVAARGDRRSGAELCRRHSVAYLGVAAGDGAAAAAALVGPRTAPKAH